MTIITAIQHLRKNWPSQQMRALDFSLAMLMLIAWNKAKGFLDPSASFPVDLHDIAGFLNLEIQAVQRSRSRLVRAGLFTHQIRTNQHALGEFWNVSTDASEESSSVSTDAPTVSTDAPTVSTDSSSVSTDSSSVSTDSSSVSGDASVPRARVESLESREGREESPQDSGRLISEIEQKIDKLNDRIYKTECAIIKAKKTEASMSLFRNETPQVTASKTLEGRLAGLHREMSQLGEQLADAGGLMQLPITKSAAAELAPCPNDFGDWWRENFKSTLERAELEAEWKENAASRADYKLWKRRAA